MLADFVKLSWHSAYESGHPLIDDQHRALFQDVNDLLAAVLSGCPKEQVMPVIDALMNDIVQHFECEDAVLSEIGFPAASAHVVMHRQLLAQANTLVKRYDEDGLAIGELFQFLANDVIAKHMLREDRAFFSCL